MNFDFFIENKIFDNFFFFFSKDEPKRENVFYLEFPPSWQTLDIFDLFSPFGETSIAWIDDISAFVALKNHENTKKAAMQLVGISGREYWVYFYQTYINQLSNNKGNKIVSKLPENNSTASTNESKNEKKNSIENGNVDKRKRSKNSNVNSPKTDSTEEESTNGKSNPKDAKNLDPAKENKKIKTE